jgi:hypothetical protein
MIEEKKPMTKKRIMAIKSPQDKAKAFVEVFRKQEKDAAQLDQFKELLDVHKHLVISHQESLARRIKKLEDAQDNIVKSLSMVADTNANLAEICDLYDKRMNNIEERSWSLRIRNYFGF